MPYRISSPIKAEATSIPTTPPIPIPANVPITFHPTDRYPANITQHRIPPPPPITATHEKMTATNNHANRRGGTDAGSLILGRFRGFGFNGGGSNKPMTRFDIQNKKRFEKRYFVSLCDWCDRQLLQYFFSSRRCLRVFVFLLE